MNYKEITGKKKTKTTKLGGLFGWMEQEDFMYRKDIFKKNGWDIKAIQQTKQKKTRLV